MTNFYIEYNPYLVNCKFMKNGKTLGKNSKFSAKSSERLQVLLNASVNWMGLAEEIVKVCNDKEINLKFRGRKIDYDDLKYCIDRYVGDVKFFLEFEEGKNDNDVMSELDKFFGDIKQKKHLLFKEHRNQEKEIFDAYEEAKNGIFEVNVIATMSSGKSTLINSLLHTELLPSANKACTAKIVSVLDNDNMEHYEAECYDSEGNIVHSLANVNANILKEYNLEESIEFIKIEGSIPSIPSNKIRLCIRDTPGPNNANENKHERLTREIIKNTNAIILYVMNATQIGTKDDERLLLDISNEMKKAGKQSRDRFIFVVNKCDQLDEEKGEIEEILEEVTNYLKKFDIVEPTIIPTSAKMALSIRKNQKGEKLTRLEKNDLNNVEDFVRKDFLHLEKFATLTPSVRKVLEQCVEEYHVDESKWEMEALIHTGIPAVEETINEYIEKYAYPIKVKYAVKDIIQLLDELNMRAKFEESILNDGEKLCKVQAQIHNVRTQHKDSIKVYNQYKKRIEKLGEFEDEKKLKILQMENEISAFTNEYRGKNEINERDAKQLIEKYTKKISEYQKQCENELLFKIENDIFQKCIIMLDEYSRIVKTILETIEIDDFDFGKISSFEKIKLSHVEDIIRAHQKDCFGEEKRLVKNPKRETFLGHFKIWLPKKIEVTERIKKGVVIDVHKIILEFAMQYSKSLTENINNLYEQANKQVLDYKQIFTGNISKLYEEIENIMIQLEKNTAEAGIIEKRVEENRELVCWISDKEKEIRTLLAFEKEKTI